MGHNPNIHKNHNNNKHVYSDVYVCYRNHANNHQNPQVYLSNEKYNQNANNHQNPKINHSNEKYNQNVHFLGYQQNPMDWLTPMEEKLLRTLREFLQVESN